MKSFVRGILLGFIGFFALPAFAQPNSYDHSVVRLDATHKAYDYTCPWKAPSQCRGNGSGFVIEKEGKKWILTNAHVVANHLFIEVKIAGCPDPFVAKVHNIGYDCDLALLEVEDPRFHTLAQPLALVDEVPSISDRLISYGFPMGGQRVCAVQGTLSRVEVGLYMPKKTALLCFQTDMAINPGNSGGPVLSNGQVIGVAFQTIKGASSIGYVIPSRIVNHFLKDTFSGNYDGFLRAGGKVQLLKNPSMRKFYKMEDHHSGVLVTNVFEGSAFKGAIFPGDVILKVDGHKIENDGTFKYQDNYYIDFTFLIGDKFVGDTVCVDLLRDGRPVSVELELVPNALFGYKIKMTEYDKPPTYFIFGGCVFQPLTANYFKRPEGHYVPWALLERNVDSLKSHPDDEVVILSRVLADPSTLGYQGVGNIVVKSINNKEIRSMKDLVDVFSDTSCDYFVIQADGNREFVLDKEQSEKAHQAILDRYQIAKDRSLDLI